MHLLDPYGLGPSTPTAPAADQNEDVSSPAHEAEIELAENAPEVEVLASGETASGDTLDPAMRFQDAPTRWGDSEDDQALSDEAPSESADEPPAEPYAPLWEDDDQGL